MTDLSLAVEIREGRGKGAARSLRRQGRIPAVVYARGRETVSVSLDPAELEGMIRASQAGLNTLFDIEGGGELAGRTVLVKELQREPVRGGILHADFFEVDQAQRIVVSVPIHLTGTSLGVTLGGILDHALRTVELACLPSAIPDEIIIDVTDLEQGHSIHVSDLPLPEGVELHTAADISVVSVVAPRIEEEPVVEELEEGAEAVDGEAPTEEGADGEAAAAPAEGAGEAKEK